MTEAGRDVIFNSHANPEDNSLALRLGAQLTAAGCQVWADMLRSRGRKDWQRRLEDCLRNKAFKLFQMSRIEVCPSAFSCHAGMKSGMSPIADDTLAGPLA